ncbi:hypothetical protein GLW08_15235 [Pontibacillus yanchengensis]|uniref:Uncharacterized protein n=2 Tax=Pontibacillus yanchengensis TaxID=462910 RepID=A0ACC7VGV3_9BACI|nr:hypothetical protein [Pontibacillus yanchengensis]MYL34938.1 hypothetical protein [Pontibacillus yanchengensis]MYL54688.1 hypothetical protein [Pontibacillus yanchengensis]
MQETAFRSFSSIHTLKEPKYFKTWLIGLPLQMNLSFKIAGYPVETITGLERTGDDKLRINVDVHYDSNDARSLHMFRIKDKSHKAKFNSKTKAIQYLEYEVDWDQDKVNVTFSMNLKCLCEAHGNSGMRGQVPRPSTFRNKWGEMRDLSLRLIP